MKIISSKDIPDHIHEEILEFADDLIEALQEYNKTIVFGALQVVMNDYLVGVEYESRVKIIESVSNKLMQNAEKERFINDKID